MSRIALFARMGVVTFGVLAGYALSPYNAMLCPWDLIR